MISDTDIKLCNSVNTVSIYLQRAGIRAAGIDHPEVSSPVVFIISEAYSSGRIQLARSLRSKRGDDVTG